MATNFKNIDYLQIKQSLKDYLKTLKEFQDFDFEASGIQQILSLLSYNTAYNAFYLNMVGAEMFLDSAQLRSSVTSRAKAIGYVPTSTISAKATVRVEIEGVANLSGQFPPLVSIKTGHEFIAYSGANRPYTFTPDRTYLVELDSSGKATVDIALVQGKRISFQYTVDQTSPIKQKFEIQNANVDINTLKVSVKDSATSNAVKIYAPASNFNQLTGDSLTYFVQENQNELFEVYFGENVVGVQPETGNIVILDYAVSVGPDANGLKVFSFIGPSEEYRVLKITTIEPAKEGKERESNDSIKLLAPLLYETQDRAVTRNDYESLIRKDNPNIEFVRVWGGESNVPPDFGKVYAAIKPKTGTRLSIDEKSSIINKISRERSIVSVEVKIVDPDYLFLEANCTVKFRSKTTTLRPNDIKRLVYDQIVNYKTASLNGFDADFSHSKLLATVDSVDRSIAGNVTTIKLKKRIFPAFDTPTRFEVNFHNELSRGDSSNGISSINTTGYIYRGSVTYIGDDGKGGLYYYRLIDNKKVIVQTGIGTVDYETGVVVINALDVQDLRNSDFIEITATPLDYDIYAPRETILILDNANINVFVESIDADNVIS
jgi:hypothetical protein